MTPKRAAEMAGVHQSAIRQQCRNGNLTCRRQVNGRIDIPENALKIYLRERERRLLPIKPKTL